MPRLLSIITCCLISTLTFAKNTTPQKIEHVIYITLDGVRWQEFFQDHQYFPTVWKQYKNELTFYGMPGSNTTIEVASIPVSLPSYQSQMTGVVQPCNDNDCGRVKVETFPEKLVRQYGFAPKDVALFATWATMHDSYQTALGQALENVANEPMHDPEAKPDAMMGEYNLLQSVRTRHDGDRYDYYTFGQAMHYFLKYRPKFMWISLAESDNYAHDRDLAGYHAKLRLYDDYIATLIAMLKSLGIDHQTMLIVTTDHGRGNGDKWSEHGPDLPESRQTWAFVWHGQLEPISQQGNMRHFSTLSIRPTIEHVFARLTN